MDNFIEILAARKDICSRCMFANSPHSNYFNCLLFFVSNPNNK